jgi:hypothetical protein
MFTNQAPFAAEVAGFEHCDDGFLALFGNDLELGSAFLKIEDAIRRITLRIEDILCAKSGPDRSAVFSDKYGRIEPRFHGHPPLRADSCADLE